MAIEDERYRILAAVRGSYWGEVQRLAPYANSSRRQEIVNARDIAVSAAERVIAAFQQVEQAPGFVPLMMHGIEGAGHHIEQGVHIALEKMGVDPLHSTFGESGISLRALVESVDLFPQPHVLQQQVTITRQIPIANAPIHLVVAAGQGNNPILGFYRA